MGSFEAMWKNAQCFKGEENQIFGIYCGIESLGVVLICGLSVHRIGLDWTEVDETCIYVYICIIIYNLHFSCLH